MKIISYIGLTLFVLLACVTNSSARNSSDQKAPTWIKNQPKPLNNTYTFKIVESDAGSDLTTARMHSQKELIRGVEREFSIRVSDKLESNSTTEQEGTKIQYSGKELYSLNIESNDDFVKLYYERVDEYYRYERVGGYETLRLYTLFAVAEPGVTNPRFDNFTLSTKYGAAAAYRSIVPGWAQFYKGSKLKGGLIMGGIAVSAVAAIAANNSAYSYYDKVEHTYDVDNIRNYIAKGDQYITLRNVFIGSAAAIYIYNIIDAIVSPGAKHLTVKRASIMPTVMSDGSFGVNGSIKF